MKKALIVLMAIALIGAFAMPAAAADKTEWSFYGSARVTTFSYDDDAMSPFAPNGGVNGFDDRDTIWGQQGNSRFGANASAGAVSGRVEIRETSEFRVIWGEWDFGMGKLGVGKNYTPANMFYSNQVGFGEANMLNTGGFYTGADGMIKLSFEQIAGGMFDFDIAFVEPAALQNYGAGEDIPVVVGSDLDTTLPQIESRFRFDWGPVQMEFGGAWLEVEDTRIVGNTQREYDLEAWAVHFGTKFAMGPFYANGNIHTGENNSLLGQWVFDAALPTYDAANDTIIDADRWGWQLVAGFKLNDMISFEAGYGEAEMDSNVPGQFDNEVSSYYVQTVLSPAPGVLIIPEIGERDYDNVGNVDRGDTFYFGAVWKISF